MATTGNANLVGSGKDALTAADLRLTRSGWTAWTGTPTRTTVATGSATAGNCAEALKALIDDLLARGHLTA